MKQVKNTIDELIQKNLTENYHNYYRLAYSYVHNEADAMDIVQEGAYKAILKSSQLQNPEYLGTWIYRIMVNEALSLLRKNKSPYEELTDNLNTTVDCYEDLDLKSAIERLGEPDGTIIKLRFYEDMKLEQIAAVIDENINTVKSRLYRSLKRLRLSLE